MLGKSVPKLLEIFVFFYIAVYLTNILFPKKNIDKIDPSPSSDLIRGGDTITNPSQKTNPNKVFKFLRKFSKNRELYIGLFSLFGGFIKFNFEKEIIHLLASQSLQLLYKNRENLNVTDTTAFDMIEKYGLEKYANKLYEPSRRAILEEGLSNYDKMKLFINIKLKYLINHDFKDKNPILIISLIVFLLACSISGVLALSVILAGFHRLLDAGVIDVATFRKLVGIALDNYKKHKGIDEDAIPVGAYLLEPNNYAPITKVLKVVFRLRSADL